MLGNDLDKRMSLRLSKDDFDFICEMAALADVTPSKYIRMTITFMRQSVEEYRRKENK